VWVVSSGTEVMPPSWLRYTWGGMDRVAAAGGCNV